MSREIKFRALSNGEWYYSDDEAYCLKEYDGILYLCEDENYYKNNPDGPKLSKIGVAIQSTGLKDRHGLEVFEGDVIKYIYRKDHGQYDGRAQERFKEVRFASLGFEPEYILRNESVQVVGNIYENPELLENNNG